MKELARHEIPFLENIQFVERSPDHPKSPVPVFISPGWSETPKVYEDAIDVMVNANRRVFALQYGGDSKPHFDSEFPAIEMNRAVAFLNLIGKKDIDKIDVIAISEGALSAIIAASIRPDKFRNIVLVNPAGMIGSDSLSKLLRRFTTKTIQNVKDAKTDKHIRQLLKEGTKYLLSHLIEGLRGVRAISQSEIDQVVRDLHKYGIKIVIMSNVDDPLFPIERIQNIVKQKDIAGFISMKGGHDSFHSHPNYAQAAEALLTSLEQKEQKG